MTIPEQGTDGLRELLQHPDSQRQVEDGSNMEAQPEAVPSCERTEYEVCTICSKAIWSLHTRYVGGHYMDYTCGMPIKHLLDAINAHIVNGIVQLVRDGMPLKDACIRAGVRHLDVKELTKFEALL